jgi:steroid 5-alpha reductase family enzyme
VSAWAVLGLGAALALAIMLPLYLVQLRSRDASLVDVGWTYGIGAVGILFAVLGPGAVEHRVLAALLAAVWSARLGTYILLRVLRTDEEDSRYAELRRRWDQTRFFVFYLAQAAFVVVFSIPLLLIATNEASGIEPLEWVGLLVWATGVGGEALADRQLSRWKRNPANRGRTARSGLWRYSRHPNYFFEWITWVGIAIVALAAPWGWLGLLTPLFLLLLVLFVTGIPPSEERALASRGDDYRRYQRETSAFVPWIPKR